MSNNTTTTAPNLANISSWQELMPDLKFALQMLLGSHLIFMIIGTIVNVWLLLCILTSRQLRERLRNQLICNLLTLHVLESVIESPAVVAFAVQNLSKRHFGSTCSHVGVLSNVEKIESFIASWLLIILISTFLARTAGLDLSLKLKPRSLTIGKIVLHATPWVVGLVLMPALVYYHTGPDACLSAPYSSMYIFVAINSIAPLLISLILMVVAICLEQYHRRVSSAPNSYGSHLMSRDEVQDGDNSWAYVAAMIASLVCDICGVVFHLNTKIGETFLDIKFEAASVALSDVRVILMVFPWFLLADVRERAKTWRPWYQPGEGIDLTVAYNKEAAYF